jgi:hypothetical protein
MKLTATNGNSRNGIEGQRVTVRLSTGQRFDKVLPAGNAIKRLKYRAELLDFVTAAAVLEGVETHKPKSHQAAAMVQLFAANKARMLIIHGRKSA